MSAPIQCPKCRAWLLEGIFNQSGWSPCPACGISLHIEVFPALFRKTGVGRSGETILFEGESSCFYHPQKKAIHPCDSCGRFLCALCDCELNGQHFCPTCLEAGKTKGKIKGLDHERTLYDSIALTLAVGPLIIFYFTLITAPMALFIAVRYWKSPLGLVRRSRFRFVIAIMVALIQIAGWAIFFIYLATRQTRH
jgi:hypothetical protein